MAAGLLLGSLKLPLWQMRMEAPQYQDEEALDVMVYPGAMRGDLAELKVLNSYIGVHIPEELPQRRWLPAVLVSGALLGLLASFLPRTARRWGLLLVPGAVVAALVVAAAQAQWQMHQVGHERDEKTRLVGVKDFTAPLLGRTRVAQFTITAFLSWGSLLIGGALALQFTGAWLSRKRPDAGPLTQPGGAPSSALKLAPGQRPG